MRRITKYGRVTPRDLADLAAQADRAGQLMLSAFLYSLAVDQDEHQGMDLRIPRPFVDSDRITLGHKLATPRPRKKAEP